MIEIAPDEFGHGRTRNLAAERASGDVIAFLTQDATPVPGWLAADPRGARAVRRRRRGVRPAPPAPGHQPDDRPRADRLLRHLRRRPAHLRGRRAGVPVQRQRGLPARLLGGDPLRRRAVQRGPGVRPRTRRPPALAQGVQPGRRRPPRPRLRRWSRSCAATSTSTAACARRSITSSRWRRAHRCAASATRWPPTGASCASRAIGDVARWTARSVVHHSGRKAFAALGSRAGALPPRGAAHPVARGPRRRAARARCSSTGPRRRPRHRYDVIARAQRTGPAPLLAAYPGMADRESLHIAWIVPTFNVGSGGHYVIFQIVERLERMGHTCSIWVHDAFGAQPNAKASVLRRDIVEHFAPVKAPVFLELDEWYGADVAVATGWQTVYPTLELDGLPGARLHGQRPRARVLPDVGRARVGGEHLRARAATASSPARGCATCTSTATAARPGRSNTAWTSPSTTRARYVAGATP